MADQMAQQFNGNFRKIMDMPYKKNSGKNSDK
jgi:hypothetical protein